MTRIVGMETFLLSPAGLAADLQRRFAASATVAQLPGAAARGHEVVLQVGLGSAPSPFTGCTPAVFDPPPPPPPAGRLPAFSAFAIELVAMPQPLQNVACVRQRDVGVELSDRLFGMQGEVVEKVASLLTTAYGIPENYVTSRRPPKKGSGGGGGRK